mgnify:CR=1 FL=1
MSVYVSNLTINSGADFSQVFTLENASNSALNLVGYGVTSEMRKHYSSSGVTTFSSSLHNASLGQIKIELTSEQTSALKSGRYVYDILITNTENVTTRVVEGMALVREGVTRNVWNKSSKGNKSFCYG